MRSFPSRCIMQYRRTSERASDFSFSLSAKPLAQDNILLFYRRDRVAVHICTDNATLNVYTPDMVFIYEYSHAVRV